MNSVEVLACRGGSNIFDDLFLEIDGQQKKIELTQIIGKQYNIRFVFETAKKNLNYPNRIFGKEIFNKNLGKVNLLTSSKVFLKNIRNDINHKVDLDFDDYEYLIGVKVFEDLPIHQHGVLETVPVPTNILNVYIYFYRNELLFSEENKIQKHFDGYNHLGFLLVDLPRMTEVIEKEYGQKELDLVYEFSNSEIIDKLFEEEIIMIVWGINPYTYPIYSVNDLELIKPLIGREFEHEGIFNIDENIKELSIVPGYELNNWPRLLNNNYPKIALQGKGTKTYLKPFCLEDSDLETVITSFVIYRTEGVLEENKPLINVDLLYS